MGENGFLSTSGDLTIRRHKADVIGSLGTDVDLFVVVTTEQLNVRIGC